MALTDKQLDDLVEEILSGKQERFLEEMTNSAVSRFEKAAAGLGGTQTAEAQLEQLARDWPSEAKKILAKYSSEISEEVARSVENTLMACHKDDEADMQAYIATGAKATTVYASGITTEAFVRRAAQAAQGIASIIRRQNILMEEAAEKTWYEACEEAVNRAVLGTMPEKEIIAKGIEKMGDIGKVTYGKNGKKTVSNFVDVAIRRHVRTQTAQAGARMTTDLLDSYGHDLVITDAHWGARPSHAEWQGKPCCMKGRKEIDDVEYPDIRDLTGYGTVTGLLGANCQHSINPYYPGITPLPDRDFEKLEKHYGMTSDEYYEATQKQRTWERRIRQTKRDIAVMEQGGIGLESPTYVQKRLVLGKQQASIAKLCKEKKLPRQYAREKAYGVAQQPRALKVNPFQARPSTSMVTSTVQGYSFSHKMPGATVKQIKRDVVKVTSKNSPTVIFSSTISEQHMAEVIRQVRKLPKELKKTVSVIEVVDYDNPADAYWRKRYRGFTKSAGTGGNGRITLYGCTSETEGLELLGYLAHEAGHCLDTSTAQLISESTQWKEVIRADSLRYRNTHITEYAKNSEKEEFAESVKWLILRRNGGSLPIEVNGKMMEPEEVFQRRFAYLKELLKYGG